MSSTQSNKAITSNYDIFFIYIQQFRVEQCQLFLQHKCNQHRPYTCFHWHFMNQRRRRPRIWDDSSSNKLAKDVVYYKYNPDVYCDAYDEQSGICVNGDTCQFVHRNACDTERRYHPRYYKVAWCLFQTNNAGQCLRNGPHCYMAHFKAELNPLMDKMQAKLKDNEVLIRSQCQHILIALKNDRLYNEDDCWNDIQYVLENYKTVQCQRPPRVCRQGFACPQYHNPRDKRRNPFKFNYRSLPCPSVKASDEWQEPSLCEKRDLCQLCHSRTEQQFHPDIYKSTRCHDILNSLFCPRGNFCAFAHCERELKSNRDKLLMSGSVTTLDTMCSSDTNLSSFSDDHISYRHIERPIQSDVINSSFYHADSSIQAVPSHTIYSSDPCKLTSDKAKYDILCDAAAQSDEPLMEAIMSLNQPVVQASLTSVSDFQRIAHKYTPVESISQQQSEFVNEIDRQKMIASVCQSENKEKLSNQVNYQSRKYFLSKPSVYCQSVSKPQLTSQMSPDKATNLIESDVLNQSYKILKHTNTYANRQISLEAMISRNLENIGIEDGNFVFEGEDKIYNSLEPQTPIRLPDTGEDVNELDGNEPSPLSQVSSIRNQFKSPCASHVIQLAKIPECTVSLDTFYKDELEKLYPIDFQIAAEQQPYLQSKIHSNKNYTSFQTGISDANDINTIQIGENWKYFMLILNHLASQINTYKDRILKLEVQLRELTNTNNHRGTQLNKPGLVESRQGQSIWTIQPTERSTKISSRNTADKQTQTYSSTNLNTATDQCKTCAPMYK